MSASPPQDERAAMTSSLPVQAAPPPMGPPTDTAAVSGSDTNVASPEGDLQTSERRMMSFEEFRQFYVASRRLDYLSDRDDSTGGSVRLESGHVRADRTGDVDTLSGGAKPRLDGAAGLRQRLFRSDGGAARAVDAAAVAATPPPAAHAPPGRLALAAHAVGVWVNWLMQRVMQNMAHVFQLLILIFFLYSQVGWSGAHVLCLLAFLLLMSGLKELVQNFQITHEAGTTGAPSFLGRLFKPEGHQGPVSTPRRIGYIVAKCVEAFVLSFFPMYSVENLERELGVDGIVR
ncbi:hypothetical protein JKF63_06059 [Porcisia hertigi]|uniref:Uncharacterized protein n=1 Tax=Porcisia hertigi TaxID=2761500 RepID=A0A836IWM4_9TRYP|nr:hypothetical protein JKF63_06059 [Porcisia hertigi]